MSAEEMKNIQVSGRQNGKEIEGKAFESRADKEGEIQNRGEKAPVNKMTVNMTKEALYDFLLFHAYSKFTGFLINILGLAVAFMGFFSYATGRTGAVGMVLYLAAAALFLGSTPLQLKMRAKKQVVVNREYNVPAEYTFSEEGISIEQNGEVKTYAWDQIERAVVTPKTIGIYYAPESAMILPKEDFGDQFVPIFTTIATQLGQSKVRMR